MQKFLLSKILLSTLLHLYLKETFGQSLEVTDTTQDGISSVAEQSTSSAGLPASAKAATIAVVTTAAAATRDTTAGSRIPTQSTTASPVAVPSTKQVIMPVRFPGDEAAEDQAVAREISNREDVGSGGSDTLTIEKTEEASACAASVLERREFVLQNNLTQLGVRSAVQFEETLLIFTIIFVSAMAIAGVYKYVQSSFYEEDESLDSTFDAGGNVGSGITASTLVSQWTWAATLLQSSSVGAAFGISGPYWYAAGATIQVLLMAIVAYYLKLHAPGAKTFLQIIRARFGSRTHIIVMVFALFTNIIVTLSLLLGGTAVLTGLVDGLSPEFASMLLVVLVGGFTLIGGLGATFYVSYFTCAAIYALIVVFVLEVFYNPFDNVKNPFHGAGGLFQYISCWPGPEGNQEGTWLTFYSSGGLIFGIVNIVGNFGAVFVDQAYWQSAVATKPRRAVWGFLAGGMTWFAVPFGLATTMSLGYHGLSSAQGESMLQPGEISRGLVVPLVSEALLGKLGGYATIVMVLTAVMSTGSAEIIAVASIIIYDIYIPYIKPFKTHLAKGYCILCEKPLRSSSELDVTCSCPSMEECSACIKDDEARNAVDHIVKPIFQCPIHAEYRDYESAVINFKSWAIIYCTLSIIPVLWPAVIFGEAIGLDLGWIYLFTGVLVASAVIPVYLSLVWTKTTSSGVSLGSLLGAVCALIAWMTHASTYEGGLSNFMANTGKSLPMMTGNVVAIVAGGLICAVVSYYTKNEADDEELQQWNSTRDIDNPLRPWTQLYKVEFDLKPTGRWHDRPPLQMFEEVFRTEKRIAYWFGGGISIFMVLVWPLLMLESVVQDQGRFLTWTGVSQAWTYCASLYIICVPLVEEVREVYGQYKLKKQDEAISVVKPFVN